MIPIVIDCELETLNNVIECELETEIHVEGNVTVTRLEVTENGTYQEDGVAYSPVEVNVEGMIPTGTIEITENGTHNVTEYAEAVVNVGGVVEPYEIGANESVTVSVTKTAKPILPSGYTQVEYIESHGTEYIDTGVTASYPVRAYADMEWVQVPSDGDLLGARSGSFRLYMFHIYGGWCLGFGSFYSSNINPAAERRYEVEIAVQNGYQVLYIDGANQRVWTNSETTQPNIPFYLFAMNYNGNPSAFTKAKVYALQIRSGVQATSPLVCDLVPCLEEATGKYGLFDMVSMTFKGNQGTGDFTGGPEMQNYSATVNGFTESEEALVFSNLGLIFEA